MVIKTKQHQAHLSTGTCPASGLTVVGITPLWEDCLCHSAPLVSFYSLCCFSGCNFIRRLNQAAGFLWNNTPRHSPKGCSNKVFSGKEWKCWNWKRSWTKWKNTHSKGRPPIQLRVKKNIRRQDTKYQEKNGRNWLQISRTHSPTSILLILLQSFAT